MNLIFSYFQKKPSILVIISIVCFVLGVENNLNTWRNKNIIKWDIVSYYSYLPAQFIEHDIELSFINDSNRADYNNQSKYIPTKTPNGKWAIKTSMGMSVMYAPFFFLADQLAKSFGYESNGFSEIYHGMIMLSGLFYLILGLFFLRKSLLLFYSEKITALTVLLIYFGTNLLCYSTIDPAMSHEYNFSLFSIFIYGSIQWLNQPRLKYIILSAITFGLLFLIRPINLVFILFPLLFNVKNLNDIKERGLHFIANWKHTLLFIVISILIFVPQMLYWKLVSGQYLYFSYVGEQFFFNDPHIWQCAFGFRKGWFIYSPLMLFSVFGIYFLYNKQKAFFVVTLITLSVYYYIVSSWWCWWYGGSFGLRAMIDLYPLLAFPLASWLASILFQKNVGSKIIGTALTFLVVLNLFNTIQYHYNIIHYDSMTMKAYFNSFGKISKSDCDRNLLRSPDYEKARTENQE